MGFTLKFWLLNKWYRRWRPLLVNKEIHMIYKGHQSLIKLSNTCRKKKFTNGDFCLQSSVP